MSDWTAFLAALDRVPPGYSDAWLDGRHYGMTRKLSADGKRESLFAREIGGTDIVSFNLYRLASGEIALRPCEMSSEKVTDFVVDHATAPPASTHSPRE